MVMPAVMPVMAGDRRRRDGHSDHEGSEDKNDYYDHKDYNDYKEMENNDKHWTEMTHVRDWHELYEGIAQVLGDHGIKMQDYARMLADCNS